MPEVSTHGCMQIRLLPKCGESVALAYGVCEGCGRSREMRVSLCVLYITEFAFISVWGDVDVCGVEICIFKGAKRCRLASC